MKKGFTLIEVIVVLVIISIISLITVPIVLKLIDKSKISINKRNIENYVHSLEIAMAEYKLEHGYYSYDLNELNVVYTGKNVECDIVNLNENGTVYVNKCKIDGEYVEDENSKDGYYHYGIQQFDYQIGDLVMYKGIEFYVIKNSVKSDKSITLIKAEPIYGSEISDELQSLSFYDELIIRNYSLSMRYMYDDDCGYNNNQKKIGGCRNDYESSDVKKVVDLWESKYIDDDDKLYDSMGYSSRLISKYELFDIFDCKIDITSGNVNYCLSNNEFLNKIISKIGFTMVPSSDYLEMVYQRENSLIIESELYNNNTILPIVNLKKSAIEE